MTSDCEKKGGGVALYPKYHQIVMKIGMQLGFQVYTCKTWSGRTLTKINDS